MAAAALSDSARAQPTARRIDRSANRCLQGYVGRRLAAKHWPW